MRHLLQQQQVGGWTVVSSTGWHAGVRGVMWWWCVVLLVAPPPLLRRRMAAASSSPIILVTGGNAGIGLALCAQLLMDHNARVFMGSRSVEKGNDALALLDLPSEAEGRCTVVQCDVTDDASVVQAAVTVKNAIGGEKIYAVVNNAGTGLKHGTTCEVMLDTNFYGPKRVSEAFLPLLDPVMGRIVNVGSGSGGMYVSSLGETDAARLMIKDDITFEEIESHIRDNMEAAKVGRGGGYGLSKAAVAQYTKVLAHEHPNIMSSCCTPGFINTALTKGWGAKKSPAEGTPAIKKLLFEPLAGNGWYYGSDGVRSPYHFMRNPGEPEYDGKMPF